MLTISLPMLPDVITLSMPTCLCGSLPQSVQTAIPMVCQHDTLPGELREIADWVERSPLVREVIGAEAKLLKKIYYGRSRTTCFIVNAV